MSRSGPRLIVALAFVAFVSLGLPDGVLGVAWPSIRAHFDRPLSHLGILLAGGIAGYLVSSFFGGEVVRAVGVGRLLLGSSVIVAAALALFSLATAWWVVVLAAALGGLGAGAIDAGINTFAASRFSPRVVNWLHACWGIGATTGPLLMTAVLARRQSWQVGYAVLGAAMALLSLLFLFTLRLWTIAPAAGARGGTAEAPAAPPPTARMREALRLPLVWVQFGLFFLYCGIESAAGQLLYSLLTESRGMSPRDAGLATGGYWASLTAGRILFGQLSTFLGPLAVLRIGMAAAPVSAALVWWDLSNAVSVAGAALLGFSLAPVFPTLISVTPQRVGARVAPQAVGFQVAAANLGIAVLPGAVGVLARRFGLEILGGYLVGASLLLLALHEMAVAVVRRAAPTYTAGTSAAPA